MASLSAQSEYLVELSDDQQETVSGGWYKKYCYYPKKYYYHPKKCYYYPKKHYC
jgi:hypothetical protein